MAALTITAADVAYVSGAFTSVQVGEAVTQGEPLRQLAADNKHYLCNQDTAVEAGATLLALTSAATDGFVIAARIGAVVIIGATVAIGTVYAIGAVDGAIAPIGDLASGDFVTVVGHAISTTELKLTFDALGVAKA